MSENFLETSTGSLYFIKDVDNTSVINENSITNLLSNDIKNKNEGKFLNDVKTTIELKDNAKKLNEIKTIPN